MKKILILLSMVVILTLLVLNNYLKPIDDFVYNLISFINNDYFISFNKFITNLGDALFIIIVLIILLTYLLINKDKINFINTFLLVIISAIITLTLKNIFAVRRPNINQLIFIDGYSYPSGHSLNSFVFYKNISNILNNKIVKIISCILLFLIGLSRIYLGVHNFSDVVAGMLIGYLVLSVDSYILSKNVL